MHMRHTFGALGSSYFFFSASTGLASHSVCSTSTMKPATSNFVTYSPMIFLLSSANRRKGCRTGFASFRTFKECSANSLGTPTKSSVDQAKIFRFSRRKLTSALSYASLRPASIRTVRSGYAGSSTMSFVSLVGLNAGVPKLPLIAAKLNCED